MTDQPLVLPMSLPEAKKLGIKEFDIILVTGDAYVDHPSFGTALIGRVLWDAGFTVGVISQPDWKDGDDLRKLGKPRLFFGVTSGNVDSMVNNYTANLKVRNDDVYSPGGKGGLRPNRAAIVYSDKLHSIFPGTPIVLGGIEASLRRFAHYDYWSDSVRQSILADSPADMLVFGMGETQILEIASRLSKGQNIKDIRDIAGTSVKMEIGTWRSISHEDFLEIPGFIEVSKDKQLYATAFKLHYYEQDPIRGRTVAQAHPKTIIIQNKPAMPLTTREIDHIYGLPFSRKAHPSYNKPIPALAPVKFSVISHRGCFGSCSFCALTHHQGKIIQSRSMESIIREVIILTKMPDFKGIVQDVGGPSANMYSMKCRKWEKEGVCTDKMCMDCKGLDASHKDQVELLSRLLGIKGVKNVFIGSGIRFDLALRESSGYISELCQHHVSGHLKVAPEHVKRQVTDIMHKPGKEMFEEFRKRFDDENKRSGKRQFILPYFMSGHPGCTVEDMIELAEYIRDNNLYTEQVQDFTPTPMTASTCMYHTGIDPFTMKEVHVAKGREKRIQRALLQYREVMNYGFVVEGLKMAGREDLIGSERKCLIKRRTKN
ncbi:MAG: YgiQ family radical SAM protein [Candidatus Methanoperedens sp.]|nr:YgiQ family radical SAM protein [Candidatus Methanoperedens sp.]